MLLVLSADLHRCPQSSTHISLSVLTSCCVPRPSLRHAQPSTASTPLSRASPTARCRGFGSCAWTWPQGGSGLFAVCTLIVAQSLDIKKTTSN